MPKETEKAQSAQEPLMDTQWRETQVKRINKHLEVIRETSPFYRKHLSESPQQIGALDELCRFPVTTKADLSAGESSFLSVERSRIIDWVTTSGTSGMPVAIGLTENDLERLAENEARSFEIAGVRPGDTIQLMTTIDRRFMAGLAYFLGARKLGAGIVRVGNGIPELQWDSIRRFEPEVLIAVPGFILKLIDYAKKNEIDLAQQPVRKIICIGDALRDDHFALNALGKSIRSRWEVELHSTYASTEMATAFTECPYGRGGHWPEDLVHIELVDENNQAVKAGEPGEIVATPFGVEGMPFFRYKTGDVARLHTEPCACGRKTPRIGPVIGRKQQLIKFKGTTIYPSGIHEVMNRFPRFSPYVIQVKKDEFGADHLRLIIADRGQAKDELDDLKGLFQGKIRVVPELHFVEIDALKKIQFPPLSRKPVTFLDEREGEHR